MDWAQIVEQHGPLVWRTAQRLLGQEADAADCFQRTFISALELSRTQTIQHWPGILRKLTVARALEQLRQRIRERNRFASTPERNGAPEHTDHRCLDPEQIVAASELEQHLQLALAAIDARQAEVFCLACLEDCTYVEIAEALGITTNHVGVLLTRAKTALRERLKSYQSETAAKLPSARD
jgi:RNA polymerase sigma-70 factor, ECF subfamily